MISPTVDPESLEKRLPDGPALLRLAFELDVSVTPMTAYASLAENGEGHRFLLESAEKIDSSDPDGAFRPSMAQPDRHARFSFVGTDPIAVVRVWPDRTDLQPLREHALLAHLEPDGDGVIDRLRGLMPDLPRVGFEDGDRQHLEGGLVGYLAYDAVYDLWLEPIGIDRPESSLPDAEFVLATSVLSFDEIAETVTSVHTTVVDSPADFQRAFEQTRAEATDRARRLNEAEPPRFGGFHQTGEHAGSQQAYESAVKEAKEHVLDGDIYQGVISRHRELTGQVDPLGFYQALREVNPSPYMYLLEFGDRTIVGASPETLVSVTDRTVTSNPIAGTCPRGSSPVEDRRLAGEMLADEKERAEHTMLVDLARNDVRRVGQSGSVRVDEFMNVLKYSHVQHIESTVTARLAEDADVFDATRATFPAGTLSGAPKIRAMEIIDELESVPRGVYGGGVGYFSWDGDADFAIVIRSATIEHGEHTDRIRVQAGAGIVAQSDPTAEFEETEAKMDGVLAALDRITDEPPVGEVR